MTEAIRRHSYKVTVIIEDLVTGQVTQREFPNVIEHNLQTLDNYREQPSFWMGDDNFRAAPALETADFTLSGKALPDATEGSPTRGMVYRTTDLTQ